MSVARRDTGTAERVYLPREGLDRIPIFHAHGYYLHPEGEDQLYTRCGLLVYRWSRPDGVLRDRTALRLDHAEAIGRPCRRCWPPELVQ